MRVLYVEDDDNLAFAVERMLRQEGFDCDRARSGVGAVKLGQEHPYDVIVLDVMLPDIDGYEVLRQLQENGVETPILIQSGLVERDQMMDGLGFGVDDYLIKPFNRDELIRRVQQAATRSGRPSDVSVIAAKPVDPGEAIALPPPAPALPPPPPAAEPAPIADPPPPDIAAVAPQPAGPAESAPTERPAEMPAAAAAPGDTAPLPNSLPELPARIVAASSDSVIDCTIVTVASGGAVLDLYNETVDCPDEFLLAVTGDKSYRCESCWRHGGKLGVKFI